MAFVIYEEEYDDISDDIPDDYVFVNEYINSDDDELLELIIKQTVSRFFSPRFNSKIFIQNLNLIIKN